VKGALALSGVFELEPLRHAPFLAPTCSSTRRGGAPQPDRSGAPQRPLFALVGGDESEEFLRQKRAHRRDVGRGRGPVCEAVPGRTT
jgi:arylformamidase